MVTNEKFLTYILNEDKQFVLLLCRCKRKIKRTKMSFELLLLLILQDLLWREKFLGHICSSFCNINILNVYLMASMCTSFREDKMVFTFALILCFFHLIKFCSRARLNCFYLFHNLYCTFLFHLSDSPRHLCSKVYFMGDAQNGFEFSFR